MHSDREDARPILERRAVRKCGRILWGRSAGSILVERGPLATAGTLHPLVAVWLSCWGAWLRLPTFGLELPLQADQLGLQYETGENVAQDDRLAVRLRLFTHRGQALPDRPFRGR